MDLFLMINIFMMAAMSTATGTVGMQATSADFEGRKYLLSEATPLTDIADFQHSCTGTHGGYLAEIDSEEEYSFIMAFVAEQLPSGRQTALVGAKATEDGWTYMHSGQLVKFFSWYSDYGSRGPGRECMYLIWNSRDTGMHDWKCRDSAKLRRYVCEVPKDCPMEDLHEYHGLKEFQYSEEHLASFQDCKDNCMADAVCKMVTWNPNLSSFITGSNCFYLNSSQAMKTDISDYTSSSKMCEGDSTQAPMTSDAATDCQLTELPDKQAPYVDGNRYHQEPLFSLQECKDKCLADEVCTMVEWDAEWGFCLYSKNIEVEDYDGGWDKKTLLTKKCGDCPMEDLHEYHGLKEFQYSEEHLASFQDCKDNCMADAVCKMVTWNPNLSSFITGSNCFYLNSSQAMKTDISDYTSSSKMCEGDSSQAPMTSDAATDCQLTELPDKQAPYVDGNRYHQEPLFSLQECKDKCLADEVCTMVEWDAEWGFCLYSKNIEVEDYDGGWDKKTLLTKKC